MLIPIFSNLGRREIAEMAHFLAAKGADGEILVGKCLKSAELECDDDQHLFSDGSMDPKRATAFLAVLALVLAVLSLLPRGNPAPPSATARDFDYLVANGIPRKIARAAVMDPRQTNFDHINFSSAAQSPTQLRGVRQRR